jgi:hypothetical protein
MKPKYWGILLLITFGAVKLPLEDALTRSLREQRLQLPPPELSWGENFWQMAFSMLGGLRNLAASVAYIQSYTAFEKLDWGTVDNYMMLATRMQPTEISYWDEAAWNMSHNAASAYLRDRNLRFAAKHQLFRKHVARGIAILEEGLRYNPNNPRLLQSLGEIYGGGMAKQPDPRLAAKYFMEAYENGSKEFYERMAAYEMVKLNDRASWEKAYEILKRYYDKGEPYNRMGSIVRDIPKLEELLGIPAEKRIKPRPPRVPRKPLGTRNPGGTSPP